VTKFAGVAEQLIFPELFFVDDGRSMIPVIRLVLDERHFWDDIDI